MKRWPIIRHLRWAYWSWRIAQHHRICAQLGLLPLSRNIDDEILNAMWNGEE